MILRNAMSNNIMHKHTLYRIIGHTLVAYFQITNYLTVRKKINEALPTHPELEFLSLMMTRFFTLWNVLVQVAYALLALLCDVTSLFKVESIVPTQVRQLRVTIYSGLVFPMGVIVTLFWPVFIYDRKLIFPEKYDIVLSKTCNFLWHSAVQIYILWELVYLPKDVPKSASSLKLTFICGLTYLVTILYTRYVDLGTWPYAIVGLLDGTIYIPILISGLQATLLSLYFLQWPLKDYIWRRRGQKNLDLKS